MTVATPAGLTFIDREGSRSLYAFHGLVNNHVYALGAAGTEVLAGTLGGVSMLDNGVVHASYTTANSALTHNWITAVARVDDEWFVGNLRRRALPSGCEGPLAPFCRSDRTDRDQSERDGRHRHACVRRHAVARAAGLRSPRAALDDARVRAAVAERDRARCRSRAICTSAPTTASSESGHEPPAPTLALLAALVAPIPLLGDVGVLIPAGSSAPDPAILSLDQMAVDIRIDNGDARVSIRQVFASHGRCARRRVSVLDAEPRDGVRLCGLGRRDAHSRRHPRAPPRGGDLREPEAAADRSGTAAAGRARHRGRARKRRGRRRSARASCRFPGSAPSGSRWSTTKSVPVENLRSAFALPLRPDAYNAQSARPSSRSRSAWSPPTRSADFRVDQPRLPAADPRADAARHRRLVQPAAT